MNKKILLFLVSVCIISALAAIAFAACNWDGCRSLTITTTTGTTSLINVSNTLNVSRTSVTLAAWCGNNTGNATCFNSTNMSLANCSDNTSVTCHRKLIKYKTLRFNNATWNVTQVHVSTGSPALTAAVLQNKDDNTITAMGLIKDDVDLMSIYVVTEPANWELTSVRVADADKTDGILGTSIASIAFGGRVTDGSGHNNEPIVGVVEITTSTANDKMTAQHGSSLTGLSALQSDVMISVADDRFDTIGVKGWYNGRTEGFSAGFLSEETHDVDKLYGSRSPAGGYDVCIPVDSFPCTECGSHTESGVTTGYEITVWEVEASEAPAAIGGSRDYGDGVDGKIVTFIDDDGDDLNPFSVSEGFTGEVFGNRDNGAEAQPFVGKLAYPATTGIISSNSLHAIQINNDDAIYTGTSSPRDGAGPVSGSVGRPPSDATIYSCWETDTMGYTRCAVLGSNFALKPANTLYEVQGSTGYYAIPDAFLAVNPMIYFGTTSNGTRMVGLMGSNSIFAAEMYNRSTDSAAVINSNINGGHYGDYMDFVVGSRYAQGNWTIINATYILLDYFNASFSLEGVNPNGTTRFTTDKLVKIHTMHPDIDILNFQLDFQTFNGSFSSAGGDCTNCSFDLDNKTCQAEVEKVWGMFESYNMTIELTASQAINMTALNMICRTANATTTAHSNCNASNIFSTYGVGTDGCMAWVNTTGVAATLPGNAGLVIDLLNNASISIPLGKLTPTSTCEQIACEINGTWAPGDDQNFEINKTIRAVAN